MRMSPFVVASGLALCLAPLWGPVSAETDAKGFVRLTPKTVGLKPGSYMKHPAGAVHYDGAKDQEVIVQIAGFGPSGTSEVYPGEGRFGPPHKLK